MNDKVLIIDKLFDILEHLSKSQRMMGPTEIASETGLHKSTVHRLLSNMCRRGYLEKDDKNGKYRIGIKLIEVASYYINSLELQTEARPYLNALKEELSLTVHLGLLDGNEVIYAEKFDVYPDVRHYSQIGLRVPAYTSSLGKSLLSRMSKNELEYAMRDCVFKRFTGKTITNLEDLQKHLRIVRNLGWAIDDEEYNVGQRCVGAPIFDYRGEIIAAVSASGPTTVLTDQRINEVASHVVEKARNISNRMGYLE